MNVRARCSVALFALCLAGCARPATQVVIGLESDAPPDRPAQLTVTSLAENVTIEGLRAAPDAGVFRAASGALFPSSITVIPPARGARSRTVTVRLHLRLESTSTQPAEEIERVHRVTLSEGRSLRARVFFNLRCAAAADGCTTVSASECTTSTRCIEQGQTCGDDGLCTTTELSPGEDGPSRDAALDVAQDGAAPDDVATDVPSSDAAACRGCDGRCVRGQCRPNITAIAAGAMFTCGQLANGEVRCWGDNSEGQLGDGTTISRTTPEPVTGVLTARSLAAGAAHACVALTNGEGRCWGRGAAGQLGNGAIELRTVPAAVNNLRNARRIAAGSGHSIAALMAGVMSWGENSAGQLATGDTRPSTVPVSVSPASVASDVSAFGASSCMLLGTRLFCAGELGLPGAGPGGSCMFCTSGLGFSAIAVGQDHACTRVGRRIRCWGANDVGQLGDGTTSAQTMAPSTVLGLPDAEDIVSGARFSCARTVDRRVFCWGDNRYGQLGDGTTIGRLSPAAVVALQDALLLGAGSDHVCALRSSGAVVCWGRNDGGQLGDGTRVSSSVPVESAL